LPVPDEPKPQVVLQAKPSDDKENADTMEKKKSVRFKVPGDADDDWQNVEIKRLQKQVE
jgi:hypothetical protein